MRRTFTLATVAVLLGGCAVTQPQNTPVDQVREINPVMGSGYYLYVPSTYREDKPAPLVVSCHGTPPFDVAEHHIREMKMLGEENGCIVVAPELIGTDGVLGDGPIVGMLTNEQRILTLISWLGYRYNIDRNNIMITGFSGGGFPVYWVGLRHPDVFSTVVARSANFSQGNLDGWYSPEQAKRTSILVYFGQNDPRAIKSQSEQAVTYLRSRGLNVETATIPGSGHERQPEYAMRFFRRHWRTPDPSIPR